MKGGESGEEQETVMESEAEANYGESFSCCVGAGNSEQSAWK